LNDAWQEEFRVDFDLQHLLRMFDGTYSSCWHDIAIRDIP